MKESTKKARRWLSNRRGASLPRSKYVSPTVPEVTFFGGFEGVGEAILTLFCFQQEMRAKKRAEKEAQEAQDRMLFKAVPSKAELEAKKKAKEEAAAGAASSSGDAYAHLKEGAEVLPFVAYLWRKCATPSLLVGFSDSSGQCTGLPLDC